MGADSKNWLSTDSLRGDFEAELPDARLRRRLRRSAEVLDGDAGRSFPAAFPQKKDLEGFYRLIENDAVEWRAIFDAHRAATAQRCAELSEVVVAHDSSDVNFKTYWADNVRHQMAPISSRHHGVKIHLALAVSGTERQVPAGVLHAQPYVHRSAIANDEGSLQFWRAEGGLFENESKRWFDGISAVEAGPWPAGIRPVHVMDREADTFGLIGWLADKGTRFVVRANRNNLEVRTASREALENLQRERFIGEVDVYLGERYPLRGSKATAAHPARRGRAAKLSFRAGPMTMQKAARRRDHGYSLASYDELPNEVDVHLVELVETEPPAGEQAVQWLLLTKEPIASPEDVLRVIDLYRRRWVIEEYFKALKTGCKLEERQVESAATLLRVLAILMPLAWRVLLTRELAHCQDSASWRSLIDPLERCILQAAVPQIDLSEQSATVSNVVAALASLGGHLKSNGRPCWLVLTRGWAQLEAYTHGARLAMGTHTERPP